MAEDSANTEQRLLSAELPEVSQNKLRKRRFLAWAIWSVVSAVCRTLRVHTDNFEGLSPQEGRGVILVTWHGRTLIPAYLLRGLGHWALISMSQDGELQNLIFQRFGYNTVRGSTGRGGVRGALQMARKAKEGETLSFTPDGPRGPSHKAQPGVILMAEKSGAPIVPVGISASRRILMKSWDGYMLPLPFARAYFLVGAPIFIPPHLDEQGRLAWAEKVELAVNLLEKEAERRAGHPEYPWKTVE